MNRVNSAQQQLQPKQYFHQPTPVYQYQMPIPVQGIMSSPSRNSGYYKSEAPTEQNLANKQFQVEIEFWK